MSAAVAQLPVSIGTIRLLLFVAGVLLFLVAWNTRDAIWSPRYWLDRLFGSEGGIQVNYQQDGGLRRAGYVILSIALILLGAFGKDLLRHLAEAIAASGVLSRI